MPARATILLLLLAGCTPAAPPGSPPAAPPRQSAEPPRESAEPPTEAQLRALAEPLPAAPKLAPGNAHTPLIPDGSLLLETATVDGKRKPVRVLVKAEVCLRKGQLELLLCREHTKEHEAILHAAAEPRLIHAALLALGLAPGTPVQFTDPKTGDEQYRPATGPVVRVTLHHNSAGEPRTRPAQDWVRSAKTGKPMAERWVFAGSSFWQNPDAPDQPPSYIANGGDVISLSNFPSAMVDLPVKSSQDNAALGYAALTEAIPPLYSGVWVILDAMPKP